MGSSYQTPSPSKGSPKRNSAKQDSFRKKLFRRNAERTTCDICAEYSPFLEATHIIDLAKRTQLEEAYMKSNKVLPVSANDASNGLLLCTVCHAGFDKRLLQISVKGKVIVNGILNDSPKYKNLQNADVPWVRLIGKHKDYPTKELLKLALSIKPSRGKRGREILEESEESEEEVLPKRARKKRS